MAFELKIGDVIEGKYEILSEIGRGGMSIVYLAINRRANKQWAIKAIKKNFSGGNEFVRQSLITESKILTHLHHPNLPEIADIIEKEDTYLIIMDYIEGISLQQVLREEGRQLQEAVVSWAITICDIFTYLHSREKPIIYRDLKPGNIMKKPNGDIVLIDFGTAREYKSDSSEDTAYLGTNGYAAPEQHGGAGQTDARTDIYTLGATMHYLLTGINPTKPPYERLPIRQMDPAFSSGLEAIIEKATNANPSKRYQSAAEMKYALLHYKKLEAGYIKQKKKEWHIVLAIAIFSLFSLLSSFASMLFAREKQDASVKSRLHQAAIEVDDNKKIDLYEKVIRIDPSQLNAYEGILNEVFLKDAIFTRQEASQMTEILGLIPDHQRTTAEDALRKDAASYDSFCYDLGLAYFYYYEGNGSPKLSKSWFDAAAKSKHLEKSKVQRADRFSQIASFYMQMSTMTKAGDSIVDQKTFYQNLLAISSGDIAHSDNIRTALVVYKELTSQIGTKALLFQRAGISEEDLKQELAMVEAKKEEIAKMQGFDSQVDQKLKEEIEKNIELAKESIRIAYDKRENQTDRREE